GQCQVECLGGQDDAVLEEIQRADHGRDKTGDGVNQTLVPGRLDAEHDGGVLVLANGEQAESELRVLYVQTQYQRQAHEYDDGEVDDPQRLAGAAEGLETLERQIHAGGAAEGLEIGHERLDRLADTDGGQREIGPAQAQNAQAQQQ